MPRDDILTPWKRVFKATWKWKKGLLFPAERPTAARKHLFVQTVEKAIRRAVDGSFISKDRSIDVKKIRSHSGKHRYVNDFKVAGVATAAWMPLAEIRHRRTAETVYGPIDIDQAGRMLSGWN